MFVDVLRRGGDYGVLVFDSAGTTALAEMLVPGSDRHHTWIKAASALRGACRCCAKSYCVLDALEAAQLPMPGDDRDHASLRQMLLEGRRIITL